MPSIKPVSFSYIHLNVFSNETLKNAEHTNGFLVSLGRYWKNATLRCETCTKRMEIGFY